MYIHLYKSAWFEYNLYKNRQTVGNVSSELLNFSTVTAQNNTLKPNPAAGALRRAVPSAVHIVAQNLGIP